MATGIGLNLTLGAIALAVLTFRSGVAFYQKILAYLVFAALAWFYRAEVLVCYHSVLAGNYRAAFSEWANLVQIAMPVVAFTCTWLAFLSSSALDAGRTLLFLFVLFLLSTVVKIALL